MLPLKSWRRYTVKRGDRMKQLLTTWGGGRDLQNSEQLIMLWNPHLRVERLRVGDELLYNSSILEEPSRLGLSTLKKLKRMRRFPGRRSRQLSLIVPRGCQLKEESGR